MRRDTMQMRMTASSRLGHDFGEAVLLLAAVCLDRAVHD